MINNCVASQQRLRDNACVSSTVLQTVDLAQSQQVAPFFCYYSRLFSNSIVMKTFSAKAHEVTRDWYIIDATDKVLGRVATEIARRLRGKHKAEFTPHVDTGDYIVVINAGKITVTGKKFKEKMYYHHTGYPGGIKAQTARELLENTPERIIEFAVHGMLPKGHMGRRWHSKLHVFAGAEHPHQAQKPEPVKLPDLGTWEQK